MSVRSLRYSDLSLRLPKGTSALPIERDAWVFLEAAGITSALQQRAVVQLVRDLKKAQLWTKMKVIYPFVGGTATTHKWNLKDPQDTDAAFRLTFSGGWTHSSTGALPNGTNAYADTFMTDTALGNNAHYSLYIRTNNAANSVDFGAWRVASSQFSYFLQYTSNTFVRDYRYRDSGAGNARVSNITRTDGYFIASKRSDSDREGYRNNATEANSTTNMDRPTGLNMYLSALKDPTSQSLYSAREIALVTMGESLTDAEASLLYQCVDRYQKTLGRAV